MALAAIPAMVIASGLSILIGWRLAMIHAWISCALLGVLVEFLSLTVRHIPFTRPYPPGHTRLKSRWPLYVIGMFAVAYYPVQLELSQLRHGASLLVIGVCITVAVTLLDVIGRHAVRRLHEPPEDSDADLSSTTVLDISGALHGHAGR
jgi:MFS family permease